MLLRVSNVQHVDCPECARARVWVSEMRTGVHEVCICVVEVGGGGGGRFMGSVVYAPFPYSVNTGMSWLVYVFQAY